MTRGTGSLVVDVAIQAGTAGLVLAAALVVVAVVSRVLLLRRRRRAEALREAWAPVILGSLRGELGEVPRLRRSEREAVLRQWVQTVDTIAGAGQARLVTFARHAGFDRAAVDLLGARSPVARITAAAAAGRLGLLPAVAGLDAMTRSPNLIERAQAARALVRIDAGAGVTRAVPLIAKWDDCHPGTALTILGDAPVDLSAPAVASAAVAASDDTGRARLVRTLAGLRHPAALDAARTFLAGKPESEVAAACLHIVADHREPGDAEFVRRYLDHPAPFVRVQAVAALGRLRIPGDEWRLVARLGDPDWWVRYRTAQALSGLPRLSRPMLEALSRLLPDRYARGALRQALSETDAAA